mmetsp:Transcript_3125/g.6527  ORF Transcript_3125/g.6527 Transcript_3125/m.6527 type:complete len:201 (-) Transcript_3125:126-728(-)
MQLTLTPSVPSSAAITLVSPCSACLAETYGPSAVRPTFPMMEPMLTMRPQCWARICLAHARERAKGPSKLTSSTRWKSERLVVSSGARRLIPALFTRMSIRPCSLTMAATACSHACASPASNASAVHWAPGQRSRRRSLAASSEDGVLEEMTTCAPKSARPTAIAKPMPREDPVTSATLPSSLNIDSVGVRLDVDSVLEE